MQGQRNKKEKEPPAQNGPFELRVERNVVAVRVVVRDAQGRPVPNLTQDEFRLLDSNKPQQIIQFSIEGASGAEGASPDAAASPSSAAPAGMPVLPNRFVAMYFDDEMMPFENVVRTRDAAEGYLKSALGPTDRVGIFTSSGQGDQDFTADRAKLNDALARLRSRGSSDASAPDCPKLSDYEAYQIAELNNPETLQLVTQRVIKCECQGNRALCVHAETLAESAATTRWQNAEFRVQTSLRGLDQLVQRMAMIPAQRGIVFISPGFIANTQLEMVDDTIDRAVRAGVVINGLDSRGMWAVAPGGDISDPSPDTSPAALQSQIDAEEVNTNVVAAVADGTGGVFFHNNNDFNAGFRQAGSLPEFAYVLVFSPESLKLDGKYHRLKVELAASAQCRGCTVQARRGYFAPTGNQGAARQARQALNDEVFSQNVTQAVPVHLSTHFSKSNSSEAHLTVEVQIAAAGLHFQQLNGASDDQVTMVTAIFDNDGHYLKGTQKDVQLRLPKSKLTQPQSAGVSIPVEFDVAQGTYLVREVVRDSDGTIGSANQIVQVP
ncbi:MAG TPA: VWA domain-containing protein [Terriglobia bacterium]|nr:VWA domain-containing protein [Terriglobia bacterium]